MKHSIIIDNSLSGREYGSLRSFESEIISLTGADIINLPSQNKIIDHRMGHSMPGGKFRDLILKKSVKIETDVLWCVLMGPENYKLDLFKDWSIKANYRILYLFDTLQHQFPVIKRLFSSDKFNIKITSFNDAAPYLEKVTKKKWFHIEQAAPESIFQSSSYDEKIISFSSYGRKEERFHELLKRFCLNKNLYYDFTTETNAKQVVSNNELYKQYAWHLNHSLFNISWPVEVTNKERAGDLHPLTCRWFEAAMAGAIVIGKSPDNTIFKNYFSENFVQTIDLLRNDSEILNRIESIWNNRESFFEFSKSLRQKEFEKWSWKNRVLQILNLINTEIIE